MARQSLGVGVSPTLAQIWSGSTLGALADGRKVMFRSRGDSFWYRQSVTECQWVCRLQESWE